MLVSGCISAQTGQEIKTGPEIKTSAGTLVITGVEFLDSFPPGCTQGPLCNHPKDGYTLLVIWSERKDGGSIEEISDELMGEMMQYLSDSSSLYVTSNGGSVTGLALVQAPSESIGYRFALVFTLPESAHDLKLFWPGNEVIDLEV